VDWGGIRKGKIYIYLYSQNSLPSTYSRLILVHGAINVAPRSTTVDGFVLRLAADGTGSWSVQVGIDIDRQKP
jgi:hypothetical protein